MNHTHYINSIPVLMLLLPLIIAMGYRSMWKWMDKENKYSAALSTIVLLVALAPLQEIFVSDYPMSFHMLGHILILLIFPPLYWASIPVIILNKVLSNETLKKIVSLGSIPVVAYCIGMSVMWIVNIPMLFDQESCHLHTSQNTFLFMSLPNDFGGMIVLQLIAGLIYSLPAFMPIDTLRLMPLQRIVYLFISCAGCTIIGIFIAFNPAHMYTFTTISKNLYSMLDLQISGLIMWVPGCLIYISKCIFILADFFNDKKLAESY